MDAENLSPARFYRGRAHGQYASQNRSRSRSRPGRPAGDGGPTSPGDCGQPLAPCPRITTGTSTAFSTPPTGAESNLYLLDKTVAAEQVDEDHWTVTVTFWAISRPGTTGDGYFHTVATTGYSTAVLDYAHTPDGWKFTGFVLGRPRSGGRYSLYHQLLSGLGHRRLSGLLGLKLACYLITPTAPRRRGSLRSIGLAFWSGRRHPACPGFCWTAPLPGSRTAPSEVDVIVRSRIPPLGGSTETGRTLRHSGRSAPGDSGRAGGAGQNPDCL